jgi:acetyl-CoA decarbonylase/synthase complex subunit delta
MSVSVAIPKNFYSGTIKEIALGKGDQTVTVGGETCYPFYLFEGDMPHLPLIAMEVYDCPPDDWAEAALAPFTGVTQDPVAWAQKCIAEYGADLICLQLAGTNPNGLDRSAAEAAAITKKVAEAVKVPLIVWGSGNEAKDAEVLREVAEVCEGQKILIGPVVEENYKKTGALALGYGHALIASTPIDINLAKQLNILLDGLGVSEASLMMDPTTGGLGYGLEYTYSVIERMRMAALTQQDAKLGFPIICNLAREVWGTKEARLSALEDPKLGEAAPRGILMEAVTAVLLLLAGADILIMRHPEAVRLVRCTLGELTG